jgi:hypothetical protein
LPTEFDPDYLEMLRMSKYRILQMPDQKPSKCANCGSTKVDGRKYVDFGLEVDFFGIVFLCEYCLEDIAKNMGLYTAHDKTIQNLIKSNEKLKAQIIQGNEFEEKFSKMAGEVKEYFDGLRPTSYVEPVNGNNDLGSVSTESDEPESPKPKSRLTKSATGSGSKNLPSFAELLESSKGE